MVAIIFFSYQVFYISQLDETEFRAIQTHEIIAKIEKKEHELVSPETAHHREIVK